MIASAGRMIDSHRMLLTVVTGGPATRAINCWRCRSPPSTASRFTCATSAAVDLGIPEDYIRTASRGRPALLVGISRPPDGNTQSHRRARPARSSPSSARAIPDVKFSFSYDQAALVAESFNSVRDAIVLGLLLAVRWCWLFTLSALSALVAAVVVPCTIAITFVVMKRCAG